jgi:hypothetical protein
VTVPVKPIGSPVAQFPIQVKSPLTAPSPKVPLPLATHIETGGVLTFVMSLVLLDDVVVAAAVGGDPVARVFVVVVFFY